MISSNWLANDSFNLLEFISSNPRISLHNEWYFHWNSDPLYLNISSNFILVITIHIVSVYAYMLHYIALDLRMLPHYIALQVDVDYSAFIDPLSMKYRLLINYYCCNCSPLLIYSNFIILHTYLLDNHNTLLNPS